MQSDLGDTTNTATRATIVLTKTGKAAAKDRHRLTAYAQKAGYEIDSEVLYQPQHGVPPAQQLRSLVPDEVGRVVVVTLGVLSPTPTDALTAAAELRKLGLTLDSIEQPWIDSISICLDGIAEWIKTEQKPHPSTGKKDCWGAPVGRPRKWIDPDLAPVLVASLGSIRRAAVELGCGATTLRRFLREQKQAEALDTKVKAGPLPTLKPTRLDFQRVLAPVIRHALDQIYFKASPTTWRDIAGALFHIGLEGLLEQHPDQRWAALVFAHVLSDFAGPIPAGWDATPGTLGSVVSKEGAA